MDIVSSRNTLVRSMHDVGAAVWLGGALMGAVGLNGAASDIKDRRQRAEIAADGWARWAPVNARPSAPTSSAASACWWPIVTGSEVRRASPPTRRSRR